jgi:Rrf2 family protein
MKLCAQEEYGLRCLLRMVRGPAGRSMTIAEISEAEGLSAYNVAKLMSVLRRGGLVESARGQAGGYKLARPPERITVGEVLALLGDPFFGPQFCRDHAGNSETCVNSSDCALRALLGSVQSVLDYLLSRTTLKDLLISERQMIDRLQTQTSRLLNVG